MKWERSATVTTTAPAGVVWSVLTDERRWPRWNTGIQWIAVEGPLAAGTAVTVKHKRYRQTAFRVDEIVPNSAITVVVRCGFLAALKISWEIRTSVDGSTISQTVETAGPLARIMFGRVRTRIAENAGAHLHALADRARDIVLPAEQEPLVDDGT